MKILLYGINFSPELTGIGKYSGDMAAWLSDAGHDVRVISAPPYYPHWVVNEGYKSYLYRQESVNGLRIWRCPLYVPKNPKGFSRVLHLASFAISSLPILARQLFWKPDVVICVEPPIFCAPAGLLFSKLVGCKSWLHIQDFEVDAGIDLGLVPFLFAKKTIFKIESWLLRRFDKVSTISQSMMKKLDEKNIQTENQIFFPNWSDLDCVSHSPKVGADFRIRNGIKPSDFVVLYSGNMGGKQGLDMVVEAAKVLTSNQSIQFLLCGDGADKKNLQGRVKDAALNNVRFLPLQPLDQFNCLLNAADIHLVIQKIGAADLVMPSKLTNIIASGGYSLVTAEKGTELELLLSDNKFLGTLIEPESLVEFLSAIKYLSASQQKIGHHLIRSFAENTFEYNFVMRRFEADLKKTIYDNSAG